LSNCAWACCTPALACSTWVCNEGGSISASTSPKLHFLADGEGEGLELPADLE
jgi:hypothetical protein